MSLFDRRQKASEVKVDGNRFTIDEIIDATAASSNLPAVREYRTANPAPQARMGIIPEHSWGA